MTLNISQTEKCAGPAPPRLHFSPLTPFQKLERWFAWENAPCPIMRLEALSNTHKNCRMAGYMYLPPHIWGRRDRGIPESSLTKLVSSKPSETLSPKVKWSWGEARLLIAPLSEDLGLVPGTYIRHSKLPVTPAPGHSMPSGLCGHLHACGTQKLKQVHSHVHK